MAAAGHVTGLVLAADGSQPKYADAVYVALHNLISLQRSDLPAEVFHVGSAEAFTASAASRLVSLGAAPGRVRVLDMLPRLHPRIRALAARRLRSFAAKPFAMLASSFDAVILVDANALFFARPERLLSLSSYVSSGVQLFTDYVRSYHIVDPWLVGSYLGSGVSDVAAYASIALHAEIDSSVVVVDKARGWRYLNVVCALNWWKAIVDRHAWGDKDTWALAAIALAASSAGAGRAVAGRAGAGAGGAAGVGGTGAGAGEADRAGAAAASHASAAGSQVGWLSRREADGSPPHAVWGHVQFDASRPANNRSSLLYINWQPHYAAGFIPFQTEEPPGSSVACCVMLRDHWEGPHDERPLKPTIDSAAHAEALQRTFGDARDALAAVGAGKLEQPHWWGQVRYRRCLIYLGVMACGVAFAALSALSAIGRWRHAVGAAIVKPSRSSFSLSTEGRGDDEQRRAPRHTIRGPY